MDGWVDKEMDGRIDGCVYECIGVGGWVGGWVDGWMDDQDPSPARHEVPMQGPWVSNLNYAHFLQQ